MKPGWRLIAYRTYDGATNMAIDEAILQARIAGAVPPTLRLYGFDPPTVTIGLSQKMAPEVVASIRAAGFDVVRRPTGGRAVLHLNDLTYSFVGSDTTQVDGFLSTSVTESYKEICQGLMAAFGSLGVDCELGSTGTPYRHLQDCFMATTGCDLQHAGTKLIGSAQVRRKGSVLQHGSVPLNQEQHLMSKLLGEQTGDYQRHVNLDEILGAQPSWEVFEHAFKSGFEAAFGVELSRCEITDQELTVAESLRSTFILPATVPAPR